MKMESKNGFELYADKMTTFCFLGARLWKDKQTQDSSESIKIQASKNLIEESK